MAILNTGRSRRGELGVANWPGRVIRWVKLRVGVVVGVVKLVWAGLQAHSLTSCSCIRTLLKARSQLALALDMES